MSQRPKKSSARYRTTRRVQRRKTFRLVLPPLPVLVVLGVFVVIGIAGTAYSINQENHDAFCASCHTQPETTFYQQSTAASPVSLASFHAGKSTRCIDCHSGGGPLGRTIGLIQGGEDLIAFMSGKYNKPAVTTHPIGDPSCLKCHNDVPARQTFDNHFHVFLSRWQAADPTAARCVDCHPAHSTGTADQGFMVQDTVTNQCQRCHQVLRGG